MYQEPELNVEEKSNASVNKRLYKLLIIILRYTPVVLSINDILHSILSYYNINCYILSCLGGVPAISSLSVNVTTTEVQFDFNNHRNIGAPFRGLLIVRLNQAIPTGTTTTLPIVFTSGGGNPQRLTGFNGADITVAQISGTGIYLCWFEHTTNTLQLLTGIA